MSSINSVRNNGLGIRWSVDFRSGKCPKCGSLLDNERKEDLGKRFCPSCKILTQGNLIVREFTIEPPKAPSCAKISCIFKFTLEMITYSAICLYHSRRVAYANMNRDKMILERYRTGEPSPKNLWQAVHGNLKISCPVCRKFNVDPFLFSKR